MLKIISLSGTPHNLEFFRKFLQCFRDIDFFVNKVKNKIDFSNKENYIVADPRDGSRTAATSKMQRFVIIVNDFSQSAPSWML